VQGCMAKEPLDRFSSAAELATKLAALGRGELVTIVTAATPLGRARRLRPIALVGAAALGVLVVAGVLVEHGLSRPGTTAPAPGAAVARAAPAPFVTLTFESEPPGAEVRLVSEGRLLGLTPFRHAFPRRDATLVVEIARAGYAPVRLEVSTAAPRTVSATLSRAPKPSRRARARHLGSEKTIDPFPR